MPVKNTPLPVLIQDRLLHRFEGDRRVTDPLHTGAEAPGGYVLVHGIPVYMTEDIGIRAVEMCIRDRAAPVSIHIIFFRLYILFS